MLGASGCHSLPAIFIHIHSLRTARQYVYNHLSCSTATLFITICRQQTRYTSNMRSLPFIILFLFIISGDCNSLTHKFQKACSQGANEIGGNWYCSNSVKAVTYTGFQNAGTYSRVTSMSDGLCSTEPQNFNSPLGAFGAGNDVSPAPCRPRPQVLPLPVDANKY